MAQCTDARIEPPPPQMSIIFDFGLHELQISQVI